MATIVKPPSGTWKAVIRKSGWPTTAKAFRTKRVAKDWARRTEDEMVRGIYIQRASSERLTVEAALKRYLTWGIGLTHNPVQNIRRPAPGPGRDRRLTPEEQKRLLAAVDAHSNPMLGWIVRIALETGMRSSEIITLHRGEIELERRVVRLRETKNTTSRTVPLTNEATRLFREVLAIPKHHYPRKSGRLLASELRNQLRSG